MGNTPNRMMTIVKPEEAIMPTFYVSIDAAAIPPLPFEEREKEETETEGQQQAQSFTAQFNLIKSTVFSKGEPLIKALQELFGNVVQFVREKGGAAGEQLGEVLHSIWVKLCELFAHGDSRKRGVPRKHQLNDALKKRARRATETTQQFEVLEQRDDARVEEILQKLTQEFVEREAVAARALATAVAAAVPLPDDEVLVLPPPAIEVAAAAAVAIAEVPVVIEARRGSAEFAASAARRGSIILKSAPVVGSLWSFGISAASGLVAQAGDKIQACTAGVPLVGNVVDALKGPIATVGTGIVEGAAA